MSLPSVLLHDHLDGGVRPQTVIELADEIGYEGLPSSDPIQLGNWFDQRDSGSLEQYLSGFEHTIGVMQTATAVERVAYEAAVDLAADGVVYAEIRFCPSLNTTRGLTPETVVEAAASGLAAGARETGLRWGLIIDALRHQEDSLEMAQLATGSRHLGVVGFDLAGPEAGYPPDAHLPAFRHARSHGLRLTIHAGESAGPRGTSYVAAAMDACGAERLGHAVELAQDCVFEEGEIVKLGPVASRVRERRIPLEVCPASNLATSGLRPEQHPVGAFYRAGLNVTLSTDNRLMSATSMPGEFEFVVEHHGFTIDDLARTTWRSLDAAFCPWEAKAELWESAIAPAYAAAGADLDPVWR
jgi:adenosine deaminase